VSAPFKLDAKRVFVAGHRGMVGAAVARQLGARGIEVITAPRARVDLRDAEATRAFLHDTRPDAVVMAAAKVGGIHANNSLPVDFLLDNLNIQNSIFAAAHACDVQKLIFLGSVVHLSEARTPADERKTAFLTSALEPTNEAYAIAKIAGLKLADATTASSTASATSLSAMPTNLYGPGDNYGPRESPRPARADPPLHEGPPRQDRGPRSYRDWGHRLAAPRVPPCRRPAPMPAPSCCEHCESGFGHGSTSAPATDVTIRGTGPHW
jgi:nucleoside-diphosphate-sugar epimerase